MMSEDQMFGEVDLAKELDDANEIIMSLRLNEYLLKGKLEVAREKMGKQVNEIKWLNSFLVSKDLAEEYVEWKRGLEDEA